MSASQQQQLPVLLVVVLVFAAAVASAEPPQGEVSALQAFLAGTRHERALRGWTASSPACSWTGVTCDASNATVVALRLPGIGLVGAVPAGTLGRLRNLQVLSLRSNRLSGAVPGDLLSLPRLRALYLQGNLLTGAVPAELAPSLEHLVLSRNNLSGAVPAALGGLTRLRSLRLDGNRLSGSLPAGIGGARRLEAFNVSYNDLNGSIPASLARFPRESFVPGNDRLCGAPLLDRPCRPFFPPSPAPNNGPSPPPPPPPAAAQSKKKRRLIVAVAVGAGAAALLLLALLCAVHHHRRRPNAADSETSKPGTRTTTPASGGDPTGFTSSSKEMTGGAAGTNSSSSRLVFVGGGGGGSPWRQQGQGFDLEDLLRASAEVLGKGGLGTSYRATLEDGATVVVKRLRDVAAPRREFAAAVEAAAAVRHRNVAPLRGYYYSKDEKLLVSDYLPAGSLSARLHGGRGTGRPAMDWEARMRAALCAARGVAHLHGEHRLAHGNIKSSNLLLRPDPDAAALSDYGLNQLFASSAAARPSGSGYRAPELADGRRPTFKSDVHSLGVLLLELLTGRSPAGGEDLPRWVQSVVREEWTAEVFDAELVRMGGGAEEEMVALLQVAMACVATAPEARPDAGDVVRMVEEVAAGHGGRTTTDESRGGVSEEERATP